jgi:RNA-binding protein
VYLLGQIKGLGYNGKLIIRGEFAPKLNVEVMDNKKIYIGKVCRVFGPVSSPYVQVNPPKNQNPTIDLIGNSAYVRENHKIK